MALAASLKLQSAATSGNGNECDLSKVGPARAAFYIEPSGTITAGAIQCEEALTSGSTQTWVPLGAPMALATDTQQVVRLTGPFAFVRARISTAVTGGGSVSVHLLAHNDE